MRETAAWDARWELTADAVGLTARIDGVFGPGRVERICRGAVLAGAGSAISAEARNLSPVERMLAGHAGTIGGPTAFCPPR